MHSNARRYEPGRVKALIEGLSKLCDPLALASWIDKKTRDGDRPGPDPWTYTQRFFEDYNQPEGVSQVKRLFESVGVTDEVDASVWLGEHINQLP